MLFWLNILFNWLFIILLNLLVLIVWLFILNNWLFRFYIFNLFLEITLLVMLLNSENSNILYFFLLSILGLISSILLFILTLIWFLLRRLRLLNLRLHWLLSLVVYHFINFIFVMLIIFFSLVSFITVRQWRVIHSSHPVVELSLSCWVKLVILVKWVRLSCKVRWCQKAWFISIDVHRFISL